VPVVSHIMDDWPSRLANSDADRAHVADRELREVFSRSSVALSISDEMSAAFQERYGVPFVAIANGVDLTPYDQARQAAVREKESRDEVVVRYVGAVAKDMVFTTLVDVARAVDELQGELPVRFEVYTRHPWAKPYKRAIRGLSGTTILESVPGSEYPRVLASADILLIAYNFDAASVDYIRYSMPNKLPECLASGAALLAIGPSEATSIKFVAGRDMAHSLTEPGSAGIREAISKLARDPELRTRLSARGTSFARAHMNISDASARFRRVLLEAADDPPPTPLVGFRRSFEQVPGPSTRWAGSAWPRRLSLRGALRRAVSALRRR
ncbi:MAG: glycosyltransferase family protein, partial [Solirubrobacterales bacterium]